MRLVIAVLALGALAWGADERNFTGTWIFQGDQSELNALPHPPDPKVRIAQDDAGLHWIVTGSNAWTVKLDGQETHLHDGETFYGSRAKWEGAALLISTNVSTPTGSYTISDRWKLSRDGQRLTIHRQVDRQGNESESVLVYTREGAPPPPRTLQAAVESRAPGEPAAGDAPPAPAPYTVPTGTRIPLRMLNTVSAKHSAAGDKVYLQTIYPIISRGHVVIPPQSYVEGTLTEVKAAGRVKGKSEMFLRLDSLTLPNGVTRDFRSRMSGMDETKRGTLDRKEGKVEGESGKGQDVKTVATATAAGTSVGVLTGAATGHLGMGAGIGAAAGALGGLAGVLASRGPDAVLEKGSTVEMVLDRDLTFAPDELPGGQTAVRN